MSGGLGPNGGGLLLSLELGVGLGPSYPSIATPPPNFKNVSPFILWLGVKSLSKIFSRFSTSRFSGKIQKKSYTEKNTTITL